MSRWGRVIELLIVALVALLVTFGLIMGYQMFCKNGCFVTPITSTPPGPVAEEIRRQLKPCEASYGGPGCTCYTVNPNREGHEYNVDFSPFRWMPAGVPQNTAIVGVRIDAGFAGATNVRDILNNVYVTVVYPYDEYSNVAPEGLSCNKEFDANGTSKFEFCSGPVTKRSDYRIFITNGSTSPISYCVIHNAGVSYH
jgi:hypothetical protein